MRAREYQPPPEPLLIGVDGFAMLMLSTTVMLVSCGATLLLSLGYVVWVACRTRCDAPASRRILVLGMRLDGEGKPGPAYRRRLSRAAALWTRNKATEIVILGGRTARDQPSEAAAGAVFVCACDVATEAIRLEDRSRHTLENLILYRASFTAEAEPAVLLTSRFHLARSSLLAKGLNIAHVRCAAEQARLPPLREVPLMLFEAALIHWYITGRSFARITGNRRMAARIS
jgi:vancomycin permeability regulator SanA